MLTRTIRELDVAWCSTGSVAECLKHARTMRGMARDAAVHFHVTRRACAEIGVDPAHWLGAMGRARQAHAWSQCMRSWAWQALWMTRANRRERLAARGEQLALVAA